METIKTYLSTKSSRIALWWKRQSRIKKILMILGIIVVFIIAFRNGNEQVFEQVSRQNLKRTIISSGKVVSSTDLSLSFDSSGVVRSVSVAVGDEVKQGQILATLDQRTLRAAATSARGRLLSAEARYQKVLEGASNEEIALAQVQLDNAERDLRLTRQAQEVLVSNARLKLYSDSLIAEPVNIGSQSIAPLVSGVYRGDPGEYTVSISSLGGDFANISGLETGTVRISTTAPQSFGTKGLSLIFPQNFSSSQGGTWKIRIPNTSAASYVANLNAYNQAKDARDSAVASAEALVATRTAELALKRATARQPDVDAALADVITAQAGVQEAQAALEKTIIRAPANGTITKVDVKVGQVAQALSPVIILQDVSNLYLESEVGESSIALLSVGLPASIVFDAFVTSTPLDATISSIDPAATQEGDVVSYKIKALITGAKEKEIKPGMNATMTITALQKDNVLVLPGRVIQENESGTFVEKLVQERRRESLIVVPVTIGIRGDGDIVEVLSGVSEKDRILWRNDRE